MLAAADCCICMRPLHEDAPLQACLRHLQPVRPSSCQHQVHFQPPRSGRMLHTTERPSTRQYLPFTRSSSCNACYAHLDCLMYH